MVPSFITWNSTSRSMVSSRKAVNDISFSGSSAKGFVNHVIIPCGALIMYTLPT